MQVRRIFMTEKTRLNRVPTNTASVSLFPPFGYTFVFSSSSIPVQLNSSPTASNMTSEDA